MTYRRRSGSGRERLAGAEAMASSLVSAFRFDVENGKWRRCLTDATNGFGAKVCRHIFEILIVFLFPEVGRLLVKE